jgi:hypothetical protein
MKKASKKGAKRCQARTPYCSNQCVEPSEERIGSEAKTWASAVHPSRWPGATAGIGRPRTSQYQAPKLRQWAQPTERSGA